MRLNRGDPIIREAGDANVEQNPIFFFHHAVDFLIQNSLGSLPVLLAFESLLIEQVLDLAVVEIFFIDGAKEKHLERHLIIQDTVQMHRNIAFAALGNC